MQRESGRGEKNRPFRFSLVACGSGTRCILPLLSSLVSRARFPCLPVLALVSRVHFSPLHGQHTNMQLSEIIGPNESRKVFGIFTSVRIPPTPSPQGVCEPAARTKLQLLNCTQWTEQFLVGKEAINSGDTVALELLLLEVLTACPKSHTLTLLSRPPEASRVPSALKARLYTVSVCPRSSFIMLPADKSQRRMRRSSPADTRYWPSGEIARSLTEPYE